MKKIINGKIYNTETAEYIACFDNGLPHNDFNYYYEELYRKKTGEFFLSGEGGASSPYCEYLGDGWRGYGYDIVPLELYEAKEWAERHVSADRYIEIFGEAEE